SRPESRRPIARGLVGAFFKIITRKKEHAMQAESQMVPIEEMNDSDVAEEQVFSQWVNRRLALYQAMEQQVQTGVAHLLQLANEFTVRMGKETDDLLSRYRQQRLELQSQLEALRQEAQRSRQEMADERRAHAMHIAKVR